MRLLVAAWVTAVASVGVPAVASAVVPTQADDEPTIDDGGTTAADNPLLVDGPPSVAVAARQDDGADPAAGDPASADADSGSGVGGTTADGEAEVSDNDEAEHTIRLVMFALIGVAVLLALLTVYYWWHTRPARRAVASRGRGRAADRDGEGPSTGSLAAEVTRP